MELKKEQKNILQTLRQKGSLTPTEISVQTLILPDEAEQDIEEMEQYGYVKKLELKRGIEEKLVTLTQKGIDEIDR